MRITSAAKDGNIPAARAGAILQVDLDALAANYQTLKQGAGQAECAAVLKADAYGLGAAQVGPKLAAEGCRTFFVAHIDEGIALRAALGPGPIIYILHGPLPASEDDLFSDNLTPVLSTPAQIAQWAAKGKSLGRPLAAAVQIDTGMNRLGLTPVEAAALAAQPDQLAGIELTYVASHLACAEQASDPMNEAQRQLFEQLRGPMPTHRASLANSSGIFLGPDFHYDLVRPGAALYGVNPTPAQTNPMRQVARLQGKIIQVREIDTPQTVGYGATHRATGPRRIATVPVGYADGFLRSLSSRGMGELAGVLVPIVGRVSMDLITLDVTDVPPPDAQPGAMITLIGNGGDSVDQVADRAGTIGYEILTSLGRRYHRVYIHDGAGTGNE